MIRRKIVCLEIVISVNSLPALPPSFDQKPSDTTTVTEKDVVMNCRVNGAPKPQVKWLKGGQELTGGRFKLNELNDLIIKEVRFADAGQYTCRAENKFNSTEASATLLVKEKTVIKDQPKDYEVAAGRTATFRCDAVSDSSLTIKIYWLNQGRKIDFETESRYIQSRDSSLTITKTDELDSGVYTCIAATELDEVSASATLVVQGKIFVLFLEAIQRDHQLNTAL
jgi:hypothetical protein